MDLLGSCGVRVGVKCLEGREMCPTGAVPFRVCGGCSGPCVRVAVVVTQCAVPPVDIHCSWEGTSFRTICAVTLICKIQAPSSRCTSLRRWKEWAIRTALGEIIFITPPSALP